MHISSSHALICCSLVAYLVLIVIVCHFYPLKGMIPRGEIHFIKFTPSFVSTFPIQVFAFTCAQNVMSRPPLKLPRLTLTTDGRQLFPVFNEINDNSQKRMNIVIGTAIGSATLTYEVIAVFGYITFGSHVRAVLILFDIHHARSFFRSPQISSRCTHRARCSSRSGNLPSQFLSCFHTRCRFNRAGTALIRCSILVP